MRCSLQLFGEEPDRQLLTTLATARPGHSRTGRFHGGSPIFGGEVVEVISKNLRGRRIAETSTASGLLGLLRQGAI
jgi:hypothetical protein